MKIGITGQAGFVGTHLYNFLGLQENVERVPFKDEFFSNTAALKQFVSECDTIVHLAAINRHGDPQVIYDTNLRLVRSLLRACEETNSIPHILFSSSTQEERENIYGRSKKDGRLLFNEWAKNCNARFTGLVIPNVFGPFGNPFYNSFIATFCYQLTHNETPVVHQDGEVNLIYVGELVNEIYKIIINKINENKFERITRYDVPYTSSNKVTRILDLLKSYKSEYFENGIIPDLNNVFELNLFNTFLCYIDYSSFFPFYLKKHTDNRGTFVEIIKLNSGGQVSFSTTVPGITRGNHYHTRKAERFAVIKGKAKIELRRIGTEKIYTFLLDGEKPSFVDMPIWFTHNITNIGKTDLYTLFWINEPYDSADRDTYFEKV